MALIVAKSYKRRRSLSKRAIQLMMTTKVDAQNGTGGF